MLQYFHADCGMEKCLHAIQLTCHSVKRPEIPKDA